MIAALVDQSRRALYDYVRRQDHPVTRGEAAEAGRLSHKLAAFHLDKLVDAGLLRARYAKPSGEPRGRGRLPKVYEPAAAEVALTVPQRRYELIAEVLADAVAEDPTNAKDAAVRRARDRGRWFAEQTGDADLAAALAHLGFDPQVGPDGRIVLHNCPFHALAARQTALVCGLNLAFVRGLIEGLGAGEVRAELAPRPGACCVEVRPLPDGRGR